MEADPTVDDQMLIDSLDPNMDDKNPQDVTIINADADLEDLETRPSATDHETMKKLLFLEDPALEVQDETVFEWKIENWRKMDRKCRSPVFYCDGAPWRILFFPYGNNSDHASFYLEHGIDGKAEPDWYKCVAFALVLRNPNDPTNFVHHHAHHRFTADEGDWGFTRFIELRELAGATSTRDRPLLENDSAIMTAFVRVIKDPTGVLWHNFISYDSKKETGYVGLKNQGATCYLNSLLQSLYFTNKFRQAVYKIPTDNETTTSSALALQRLFYLLQSSDDAVGTTELTKSFGWETQDIFAQQDVQELNRILMERLETKMKGTEVEKVLSGLFVGKTKTYIKCIDVDYTSERVEEFWDIQLNVRGFKNLDESFRNYVAVETMDGENKYYAEGHGLQEAKKGVIFESFPEVLHLHLKRFEYDLATYQLQKVNDHYEFPESFDAAPYLSEKADRSVSSEYVLHGVLVHSGDLNAGHYYAFLRPEKDGHFFKFDDDRVTRATLRETMDDNFGEEPEQVRTIKSNPIKRTTNAYMLVYIRKPDIDNVLVPVVDEDIPTHLKEKIAEENAAKEQRRKEREEQHLFLKIRAISNKNFKAHGGFDLGSFEEKEGQDPETVPLTFRFKKASLMRELVEEFGKRLEVDSSLIRLWSMVNRQNKTVRPDQPIQDLEMTVEEAATKYSSKSDFRLWVEVLDDQNQAQLVKEPNGPWIMIFLKYYDPRNSALHGSRAIYMKKTDKVSELFPIINKLMDWPPGTELRLYEEIKPNMIEQMKPKQSFHQAEIQDGDIVCFQKDLTEREANQLEEEKLMPFAKQYYEFLVNLTTIQFIPKPNQDSTPRSEYPDFKLPLSKKNTYDEVALRVAKYINRDPTYLRFSTINQTTGAPRAAVRRSTSTTLQAMLTAQYYTTTTINNSALYYEVLPIPLIELESKKSVKLSWLPEGVSKEEPIEALVPKAGIIEDIVPVLQQKYEIPDEFLPRIRFFQGYQGRIAKELTHSFNIAGIQDYTTLYAELVPQEEIDADPATTKLVECFHYSKEPTRVHNYGIPFKFVLNMNEPFKFTKKRLMARTGIKGMPFDNIKFSVVRKGSGKQQRYLEDEDVLYDLIGDGDDFLGLDHADKNNGKSAWTKTSGHEIKIK